MSDDSAPKLPSDAADHPGTRGIWTFIFIDMIVFLLMFLVYLSEKWRLWDSFIASQHHLDPVAGLASTLFLLTSSWCMAEAVAALRRGDTRRTGAWLSGSMALGGLFVANKLFEYADKIAAGLTPGSDAFLTLYFVITGLHFTHVIGGLIFMAHCRAQLAGEADSANYRKKLENVGLFWHFVDVLWLFIFPMLYLTAIA
jgi:nitric oxide reductase NorE protein